MPCENDEEDNEAVNMTASDNYMPKDIIHIEVISRKTTIAQILKFAAKRIHLLGFPRMDLKMGFMQQTLIDPLQNDDSAVPLPYNYILSSITKTPRNIIRNLKIRWILQ